MHCAVAQHEENNMSIGQGFEALSKGQVDVAFRFFQNESDEDSRVNIGLAQALLHQKKFQQAMLRIQRVQQTNNADADILLAQALGSQGKRDQAIKRLVASLAKQPNQAALIQALLAEQKMRQGYWDDSAALFIQALSSDDPRPLIHLQHVMHDITRALASKRIRPMEVTEFLSTLQRALPPQKFPAQLAQTFQASIKQSVPLQGLQPIAPIVTLSTASTQHSAAHPPQRQDKRAQRAPITSAKKRQHAPRSASAPAKMLASPAQSIPAHAPLSEYNTPFVRTAFAESMQEQRRLNHLIQGNLQPLPASSWPSQATQQIDDIQLDIPPHLTVSQRAHDQQENDKFVVTQGNIFTQIHLEECLNAMMQSIPYEVAHTLSFQPSTLNRLEINLLDGWLEDIAQLPSDPLKEIVDDDPIILALGTFIGETLTRTYNAVWNFGEQPRTSTLKIGKHTINPMKTAIDWMKSSTKEDVRLDQAEILAQRFLLASHTLPPQIDYIDPTIGLSGPALLIRLAEVWSMYFFKLARTPHTEIIPDMQEVWQNQEMIVVRIHQKWTPRLTKAMRNRGRSKRDSFLLGYKRQTGEFFILCSRTQFSQALPSICSELNEDTSRLILRMLSQYHAPNATIVVDEHMATMWSNKTSKRIFAPTLQTQGDAMQLIFWIVEEDQPLCWAIQYDQNIWSFLPVRA